MTTLSDLLLSHEDWLMARVLSYARESGFTAYTSTLVEAWRLSISGLTGSIVRELMRSEEPPPILVDQNLNEHEAARFAIIESRRHRERGISLSAFFGLFKYYRRAYIDLLHEEGGELNDVNRDLDYVNRIFDIIEIGFNVEWAGGETDQAIYDLQRRNRTMTNEKNKYLTIFESISSPVFVISPNGSIDNLNHAAARLLDGGSVSGAHYYTTSEDGTEPGIKGQRICNLLPWLSDELDLFIRSQDEKERAFEQKVGEGEDEQIFRVRFSRMLDVSHKFEGVILILEDITTLKQALLEVKTLEGFIPICSYCKNIRDDSGYWSRLEEYLESRSSAQFSHSICNDCLKLHYGDIVV